MSGLTHERAGREHKPAEARYAAHGMASAWVGSMNTTEYTVRLTKDEGVFSTWDVLASAPTFEDAVKAARHLAYDVVIRRNGWLVATWSPLPEMRMGALLVY